MWFRWIDPHSRRSIALSAVVLSLTGLVLADREIHPGNDRIIASGPVVANAFSPTSSPFSGRGASGRMAISHGRLLAGGMRPVHAELRVRADSGTGVVESRAPVAMVLVIDTSGSMAGRKIEDARRSALAMLDEMQGDDMVSVVRFATQAEVLLPLGLVDAVRGSARGQIEQLRAEGNTDIANALRSADRALGRMLDGRIGRIVVVTDGRDTSGAPRNTGSEVARVEASRGFTVSALGIGSDYDDAYLAGISDAGRGNYEFLRDSSALSRFLSKELHEAARTRVRNVEVRLNLPSGARIRSVWGANWDENRLSLGSLFSSDERRVVVALDVPAGSPGTSSEIGGTVSWRLVDGSPIEVPIERLRIGAVTTPEEVEDARDASVMASVASVVASQRETEAAAAFERGDRARALELNAQNRSELEMAKKSAPAPVAAQLEAQKRAYEGHQGTFAAEPKALAAPAARSIGAQERKNADRAVAY